MKRSNQNNFMPFTLSGSTTLKRFSNKRKMSLVAAFSNSNQTLEDLHSNQFGSTLEEDTGLYTTYDLDLESQPTLREMNSSPYFISITPDTENIDYAVQEPAIDRKYPIISRHWAEIEDFDSLNEQPTEKSEPSVIINKPPTGNDKEQKFLIWLS